MPTLDAQPNQPVFRLDLRAGALQRDGVALDLAPRSLAILRLLVEQRGRLLTKEEILARVWRGTRVAEANVKDYIKILRQALDDDVASPRHIETVRGRGYRYVGDISVLADGPLVGSGQRAACNPGPIIAVLPFTNLTTDGLHYNYLSDGVAQDVISGLSRFRQLVVIAGHCSFALRDVSPLAAAGAVQANWIVTGSIRSDETRFGLTVELLEAGSGRAVWTESYDMGLKGVPFVEPDIIRCIVGKAAGHVERGGMRRALAVSTDDLPAYDRVLCARYLLSGQGREDVLRARAVIVDIIGKYPSYAPAYVCLADSYFFEAQSSWTVDAQAAAEQVLKLGLEAVSLDEFDSQGHLAVAWGYFRTGRSLEMARSRVELARELNPNDYNLLCLETLLALCLGHFDRAIDSALEAFRRSPLLPDTCLFMLGFAYYFKQRYAEAITTFARMNTPQSHAQAAIAACAAHLGRSAEAKAMAREFWASFDDATIGEFTREPRSWREYWSKRFPFRQTKLLDELLEGLSLAGLGVDSAAAVQRRTG